MMGVLEKEGKRSEGKLGVVGTTEFFRKGASSNKLSGIVCAQLYKWGKRLLAIQALIYIE